MKKTIRNKAIYRKKQIQNVMKQQLQPSDISFSGQKKEKN